MNEWWAYKHINGSIQVKRLWDEKDMYDATQSEFVVKIYKPFLATNRSDALAYIQLKINQNEEAQKHISINYYKG